MPFFPDSIYGLAYLGALLVFGAITLLGSNKSARTILAILSVQWLTTRLIDVYDHDNFILWLIQDYAVFTALLLCRGGKPALACAFLQLIVGLFDSYSFAFDGTFEGAAAVAETIGYLSMAIMAGGAHGNKGKLAAFRSSVGFGSPDNGLRSLAKRFPFQHGSRIPSGRDTEA